MNLHNLKDRIAVVTGASSGIGKAITLKLASEGVMVCALGRNIHSVKDILDVENERSGLIKLYKIDLTADNEIIQFKKYVQKELGRVDILVHSAGIISMGELEKAHMEDFDIQYSLNVRVPFLLTQSLLPIIKSGHGQIVFINSSAGLSGKAGLSQYSATKHALKAVADSLRAEVNADGVRVISIFPGRTATPMQKAVHKTEKKKYKPEKLLQPEDIAISVFNALLMPGTSEITDINIRSMSKFD